MFETDCCSEGSASHALEIFHIIITRSGGRRRQLLIWWAFNPVSLLRHFFFGGMHDVFVELHDNPPAAAVGSAPSAPSNSSKTARIEVETTCIIIYGGRSDPCNSKCVCPCQALPRAPCNFAIWLACTQSCVVGSIVKHCSSRDANTCWTTLGGICCFCDPIKIYWKTQNLKWNVCDEKMSTATAALNRWWIRSCKKTWAAANPTKDRCEAHLSWIAWRSLCRSLSADE